ncbi:MAG: hypothetical protein Fur0023_19300 [Bacteroidia bacterium]
MIFVSNLNIKIYVLTFAGEMGNNILIINYVFPPYPGIGGRRWAKFAKYLQRKGHNVFVIASKNPFRTASTFVNDIKELPSDNQNYLSPLYPSILLQQPKNALEKLEYHFWIKVLPFFTSGNFYDRSMLWKKQLQEKIRRIANDKNIDTIVVSGPPFHYAYETILLKKVYPHIKFIVDYRDEWTFNDVHGFGIISDKRKQMEFEKEKFVCENADAIMSCDQKILDYLNERYRIKYSRLITHGFDKDDFLEVYKNNIPNNKKDEIIISYFGTIYPGIHSFFTQLVRFLDTLKNENLDLYNQIQFYFYSIDFFPYSEIIQSHSKKINVIQQNIKPADLFKKINLTDFILLIPSYRSKDYFTTKFPEIFYLKKPVILYSDEGKVSEFIQQHHIGVHLPKEDFYETFVNALSNPHQFSYDNFNINEWDYSHITDQLIDLMHSLK